jgi:hypothetical protein
MGLAGVPPFDLGTARWTLLSKRDYYLRHGAPGRGTLLSHGAPARLAFGPALAAIRSNEAWPNPRGSAPTATHARHGRRLRARRPRRGILTRTTSRFSRRSCSAPQHRHHGGDGGGGGRGVVLARGGRPVLHFIPELLRMAAFYRMLLYGVILLLVVMFMPKASRTSSACARAPLSRCRARRGGKPRSGRAMRVAGGLVRRSPCATSRCGSAASPPSGA